MPVPKTILSTPSLSLIMSCPSPRLNLYMSFPPLSVIISLPCPASYMSFSSVPVTLSAESVPIKCCPIISSFVYVVPSAIMNFSIL